MVVSAVALLFWVHNSRIYNLPPSKRHTIPFISLTTCQVPQITNGRRRFAEGLGHSCPKPECPFLLRSSRDTSGMPNRHTFA